MYDLIISGGAVIDGSGGPAAKADVAVNDGRIARVGDLKNAAARTFVDATDKIVAPGFIDTHAHSEISLLARPEAAAKICQGVTTEVVGNCGFSAFPLDQRTQSMAQRFSAPVLGHAGVQWDWTDLDGYFAKFERQPSAVNVASLVGHGTLRNAVMGFDDRAPSAAELRRMGSLLERAMQQGAFGLSTGLCYAPGVFAATDEIVELCRIVAANKGLYATHLRDQSDRLEEAVEEALDIGRRADVSVLVSHHKAAGERNWGKIKRTLAMIDRAHASGHNTWMDVYPYIAGQSTMLSILPPWAVEGGVDAMLARLSDPDVRARIMHDFETGLPGWENRAGAIGWDNVIISSVETEKNRHLTGMSVRAAAVRRKTGEVSFLLDLLTEERGVVGRQSIQCSEADVVAVLAHERAMIGSDGIDVEHPHPRQYGCFARVLGEYVREKHVLSLEHAVHKMTGLPAATFGFQDLGGIRGGMRADIVVFDPAQIAEQGTFAQPARHPRGIEWVFVGGAAAVAHGKPTGATNGKVIRNRGRQD